MRPRSWTSCRQQGSWNAGDEPIKYRSWWNYSCKCMRSGEGRAGVEDIDFDKAAITSGDRRSCVREGDFHQSHKTEASDRTLRLRRGLRYAQTYRAWQSNERLKIGSIGSTWPAVHDLDRQPIHPTPSLLFCCVHQAAWLPKITITRWDTRIFIINHANTLRTVAARGHSRTVTTTLLLACDPVGDGWRVGCCRYPERSGGDGRWISEENNQFPFDSQIALQSRSWIWLISSLLAQGPPTDLLNVRYICLHPPPHLNRYIVESAIICIWFTICFYRRETSAARFFSHTPSSS